MSNPRSEDAGKVAVDFLQKLRPNGPWVLTAIISDGPVKTMTARNADDARKFVNANVHKANLYYSVNPTRTAMNSKAAKVDIAAVEYLLADLDPKDGETSEDAKTRYLTALDAIEPKPTAIVDSGNGIQVLWRLGELIKLAEPMVIQNAGKTERQFTSETAALIADIEGRTAAMMENLGSVAGTQNIDRILRLPGTTNFPNKKKLKAGRVVCHTQLIEFNGASCKLEDFPPARAKENTKSKSNKSGTSVDSLPISSRMKNLIRGVDDPKHHYASRSERVMAVLVAMIVAGCSEAQVEAVFLNPNLPISAHVLDKKDPEKYLARQIAKARKFSIDPDVEEINKTWALVIIGDKIAVMKTTADDISFLTKPAFADWFGNRFVRRGDKQIPLGKHWLRHPQRRQYEGG